MATLRNRSGKWQARVVRKGHIPVTKTFQAKHDAERWARQVESDMDKPLTQHGMKIAWHRLGFALLRHLGMPLVCLQVPAR